MMVLNILVGLVGLGFVVFVHEFGHLIAAKLVGIEVEAFSLGWGKRLIGYRWRGTDYRISIFPVGGYCKMKGEHSYSRALDENSDEVPREEGSFFAAAPWRRIVVHLAGPVMNLLLAIGIMSIIWWIGFTTETYQNRIVLASEYAAEEPESSEVSPAEAAGLATGDYIVEIDGREIRSYSDIQQMIAQNAQEALPIVVVRDGVAMTLTLTPGLEKETGAGYIGVYPWVDAVVESVVEDSPAAAAGIATGDIIVSVNGQPVAHTLDVGIALGSSVDSHVVELSRAGVQMEIFITGGSESSEIGVRFDAVSLESPDLNLFQAIGRGTRESMETLVLAVRSLRLLFRGVRLTSAVAGPVRISFFIGEVATSGFAYSLGAGMRAVSSFLALLSVVLFFMNLLPIPVLDGGQIILSLVEVARGRMPHPKVIYRFQLIGSAVVFAILIFAVFGDILFLAGR